MFTSSCTTISADVDTAVAEMAKAHSIGERKKGGAGGGGVTESSTIKRFKVG